MAAEFVTTANHTAVNGGDDALHQSQSKTPTTRKSYIQETLTAKLRERHTFASLRFD
jgi:hypothetical protein